MKKVIQNFVFVMLFVLINSCSKDDDPITPVVPMFSEENPLESFYIATGFNQVITSGINGSDFVTGYRFSANVTGKINAITLKIPDGNEFVKVNIFKVAGSLLIHSENMIMPNANVLVSKSITPITIEKDVDYIICMYTNDSYSHKRTDMNSITYPITVGNIKYKEFLVDPIFSENAIPTGGGSSNFHGDLSFVFQQSN